MQRSRIRQTLLAAFALFALPAALSAQQAAPSAQEQEVRGWLTELQDLHQKLEGLQEKALEDPQVSSEREKLGASIKTAMEKADPTLEASMARVEALQTQAMAAQQGGDQAKLQQLGTELQRIERQFVAAQQKALESPELAAQMTAFQGLMERKMAQVDPQAARLIARFQELEQKLGAAMAAAGQP